MSNDVFWKQVKSYSVWMSELGAYKIVLDILPINIFPKFREDQTTTVWFCGLSDPDLKALFGGGY